ncbi:MAG: DUF6498-containing protein [Methanoregula sp.]
MMQFPLLFSRILPGRADLVHNYPLISLIIANLVTIVLAVAGNWDLATVMFIYWVQSIIIGLFTVVALLTAGAARKWTAPESGDPAAATVAILDRLGSVVARYGLAGFFCLHYGIFHLAYYEILIGSGLFGPVNLSDPYIWVASGIFFLNHLYSFIAHWNVHIQGDGDDDFFAPYHRIIPMHMTIIFGSIVLFFLQDLGIESTLPVLVLFLVLKMFADIAAHIAKYSR